MSTKAPSLQTVARAAGVSRVLHNSLIPKPQTRQWVPQAANELKCQPESTSSRAMRERRRGERSPLARTGTVGLLTR